MGSREQGLERVKAVWGDQAGTWYVGRGVHWLEHTKVQERINQKVTGGGAADRFHYFVTKYCGGRTPVERALTLGCGSGELERGLAKYGFARHHDAVDVADGAIAKAVDLAQAAGLTHVSYRLDDLNTIELARERYDVILGVSAVHHVAMLERLYEQVSRALKPGGYFFLDEFIGPSQFQWPDAQLAVVNEQLRIMPAVLKRSVVSGAGSRGPAVRPTIAWMNESDPSESIRSAEIVPLLSRYFEVVEQKGWGGSLLHLLLEEIAGNFDERNEGSLDYLQGLFDLEDRLIAEGVLQDDFATIIARRR
jgi:2-polyprenyl-3-methyl-5-hydroxy-6-metoxy-1,4-benzoquinol methylase